MPSVSRETERTTDKRTDLTTEIIGRGGILREYCALRPYNSGVKPVMGLTSDNSNYNRGKETTMKSNSNFDDRYYTDGDGVVWYGGC